VLVLGQAIPRRLLLVLLFWEFQDAPPLVVARIVPASATVVHADVPAQATACRSLVVLLVCGLHALPALVVARSVPLPPTA
jgi:hypothetical protein